MMVECRAEHDGRAIDLELKIPPMPEVLQKLQSLLAQPEVSPVEVSRLIASDVRLTAEILRVVNSPFYGMKNTIHSVETAVVLLGLSNVINIIRAVMLRNDPELGADKRFDRFWDTATDVAMAAAFLAKRLTGIHPDRAYTMGLFHDIGIPMLIVQLPGYQEALRKADVEKEISITMLEQQLFGVNHACVGHQVAREWMLDECLQTVILHHHDFAGLVQRHDRIEEDVLILIALLKMAEHVSNCFRGLAFRELTEDLEWQSVAPLVLDYMALDELEFSDHVEHIVTMLGNA